MPVSAFPFEDLPIVARSAVAPLRQLARALPLGALSDGARELAVWLGTPILIEAGTPRLDTPVGSPALVLEGVAGRIGWTLSSALASELADRALGGEGGLTATAGPLTEMERGVLGYTIARWLAMSPWQLAAVFNHPAAMVEALGEQPLWSWPLRVTLGDQTHATHLWLTAPLEGTVPRGSAPPEAMRSLPVALTAYAGHATLPALAVNGLRPGDVVIPDRCTLDETGSGPIELRVRGAGLTFLALRSPDKGLVVEARHPRRAPVRSGRITTPPSPGGTPVSTPIQDAEQIPVTLSLEVARFELPLGDVAALAPGEVVQTAARPTDRVTLRAGDRIVASGELVMVDGEIGVRVLEVSPAAS